jgi:hypothetical protein
VLFAVTFHDRSVCRHAKSTMNLPMTTCRRK